MTVAAVSLECMRWDGTDECLEEMNRWAGDWHPVKRSRWVKRVLCVNIGDNITQHFGVGDWLVKLPNGMLVVFEAADFEAREVRNYE